MAIDQSRHAAAKEGTQRSKTLTEGSRCLILQLNYCTNYVTAVLLYLKMNSMFSPYLQSRKYLSANSPVNSTPV